MNTFIKVLVCFFAGLGAGLGTGFAGMSAAGIIGPMLLTFLGIPAYEALGIGLLSDVLASAVSAYTYKKNGNLDIKNSLPMMISVLTFTIIGSYISSLIPDRTIGGTAQIGLLIVGLKFIIIPNNNTKQKMSDEPRTTRIIKAIIGGSLVGFICGFVGAGGGMMMLFVLTTFLGYQMHMAVGTSVFIMAFTAFLGGLSHITFGTKPDVLTLILCVIFTLIWARIAAVIANKIDSRTLNRAAGIVMVISSLVVIIVNLLK